MRALSDDCPCAKEDYDLVRVHHPDSPHGRDIPQKVRHARFQSITRAYDILRGVRSEHDEHDADPMLREILRRKRMYEAHQREEARRREMRRRASAELRPEHDAEADGHAAETAELRLKDAVIVAAAALVSYLLLPVCLGLKVWLRQAVGAAIAPTLFNLSMADHTHRAAAANLAQARREAREFGHERRKEIRRRVQEYREQEEREASQAEDSASCTWQRERRA